MAEVLLRRRSGLVLAPADGLAEREIEGFPMGRDLRCTLVRHRSNPNLRHYFACLQRLADALGLPSKDVLHEMLKIECGLVTPISTRTGGLKLVPDSVAFDRLDESGFISFKRRAFEACEINFGVDPTTLTNEGAELLGAVTDTPQAENAGTHESHAYPEESARSPAPAANLSSGGAAGGQSRAGVADTALAQTPARDTFKERT